mmetsp:Transcript_63018/g.179144  ORF Transcript_63018/g.179144 Transcript_63018/m.179144 type:complete len:614 (+) Transcript_63018:79-1920(+)
MHCVGYVATALLVLVDAQEVKRSADDKEWLQGINTYGDITCRREDNCIVGSGLGSCKVIVDLAIAIPLSITDSWNASLVGFNSTMISARYSVPVSDITITGHSPLSHWSLCWPKGPQGSKSRIMREAGLGDYCYFVDNHCFLWASPCSGGCSTLRELSEYKSFCPGLRYATPAEFELALPSLNANRQEFFSRCAAEPLDPLWNHCDYANEFARVPDNGWKDLVLICDFSSTPSPTWPLLSTSAAGAWPWMPTSATGTGAWMPTSATGTGAFTPTSATGGVATAPSPTPVPLPPAPGPGLVPCGLTGGYSMWPSDPTCASWVQGDGQGGGPNTYVGTTESCHHCIVMVLTNYPNSRGATYRTPGSSTQAGECYAEDAWWFPDGDPDWITIPVIASLQYYTDLASDPCSPAFGMTMKPTPSPTAPTPSPTSSLSVPTPGPTLDLTSITSGISASFGGTVTATGDPHLQNIHGERFDLMKPGNHVLINIPRGGRAGSELLRVEAEARRSGGACADIYFEDLNITGVWAQALQTGGLRFQAQDASDRSLKWTSFGKIELKVAHGCTQRGDRYLNLYVKHLTRAGFAVGGLLGEDDHEDAAMSPESCAQRLSLIQSSF